MSETRNLRELAPAGYQAVGALEALETAYQRSAAEAVERHAHDSLLNALRHDAKAERATAASFDHTGPGGQS